MLICLEMSVAALFTWSSYYIWSNHLKIVWNADMFFCLFSVSRCSLTVEYFPTFQSSCRNDVNGEHSSLLVKFSIPEGLFDACFLLNSHLDCKCQEFCVAQALYSCRGWCTCVYPRWVSIVVYWIASDFQTNSVMGLTISRALAAYLNLMRIPHVL